MKKPKRALHVFGRMNRGGAETFIMHVYRKVNRQKVQFDFAVHSAQPGHYDEEIRALGGRIFVLPRPKFLNLPAYCHAFGKVLKHAGPFAAVHSHVHFFSGIPMLLAKTERVPIRIAHSHNSFDGKIDDPLRLAYRRLMRRLILDNANLMLGCSKIACDNLYGHAWSQNPHIRVLRCGIDLNPFAALPKGKQALRRAVGLPEHGTLVGHVGRFDTQKNHGFLIEIFAELSLKLPESFLILVGDGPLRPKIERQVAERKLTDRVIFLGIRSDVPQIMACLDVFLFPSLWEGLPVVLLEAQAAGVPCVVSDVISNEADLSLGLWYSVSLDDSLEKWSQAIVEALASSAPLVDERLRAMQARGYDASDVAQRLESLYAAY